MDEIRLGTIGSGVIVHSVLDAVKRTEGIRLEAVYSRTAEKAERLATEYGGVRTYTDMVEFLEDEAVNTVYVASPNSLHYRQVKAALQAGKHVICEKPFCTSAKDVEELAEMARDRGLLLTEAAPTSFLPNFEVLKEKLPRVGRIKLVMSNYSQYSSRYDILKKGEVPNIFNPEYAGGCLMDINFYNIYLNVALFGKPAKAEYHPNLFRLAEGRGRTDTSGVMLMEYEDFVSTNAGAKDTFGINFFQIEGEEGYIYITDGSNGLKDIRLVTKNSDETFNEQEDPDRWYYEIQRLTPLFLNEDRQALEEKIEITRQTAEVLEEAGKAVNG